LQYLTEYLSNITVEKMASVCILQTRQTVESIVLFIGEILFFIPGFAKYTSNWL